MSKNRTIDSHTPYLERVAQLIPAEIVAAHLTIQGLVYSRIRIRDIAIEISAVVLLALIPFYLRRLGVTTKKQIVLTMGSFIAWVLAASLPVHQRFEIDPLWGSIILILWTAVIPLLAAPRDGIPDADGGATNEGERGRVRVTRVWLCLLVAPALLVPPPVQAQDVIEFDRLISRERFYSSYPPGTLAFLPQVTKSEDAEFAGQWDLLVRSGRYRVALRDQYCFVLNHRDPKRKGRRAYVAIGAISVLPSRTRPVRPISMFRNQGWSRSSDPEEYLRDNDLPKHVPLTLETFVGAHNQGDLKENDRLLVHRWHGQYGDGESWLDRDFWVNAASVNAELASSLAGYEKEKPDLRFDAKLLQFAFTGKNDSNLPVAFCLEGDRRIATILMVFSSHFSQAEKRFELVFR